MKRLVVIRTGMVHPNAHEAPAVTIPDQRAWVFERPRDASETSKQDAIDEARADEEYRFSPDHYFVLEATVLP